MTFKLQSKWTLNEKFRVFKTRGNSILFGTNLLTYHKILQDPTRSYKILTRILTRELREDWSNSIIIDPVLKSFDAGYWFNCPAGAYVASRYGTSCLKKSFCFPIMAAQFSAWNCMIVTLVNQNFLCKNAVSLFQYTRGYVIPIFLFISFRTQDTYIHREHLLHPQRTARLYRQETGELKNEKYPVI